MRYHGDGVEPWLGDRLRLRGAMTKSYGENGDGRVMPGDAIRERHGCKDNDRKAISLMHIYDGMKTT